MPSRTERVQFIRRFCARRFNWGTLFPLYRWQLGGATWLLIGVPVLFSFLHSVAGGLRAAAAMAGVAEHVADAGEGESFTLTLDELWTAMQYPLSWETTMKCLFFASLFGIIAKLLHSGAKEIVRNERCRGFARREARVASTGSQAFLEKEYKEALEAIARFEAFFGEPCDYPVDPIAEEEEVCKLKTVECGAKAEYMMAMSDRLVLLLLTTLCYAATFLLVASVL
ncbi:hypothetical protein ACFLSJ_07895, partial [Verrucomicrobiota bacterium]